MIKSHFTFIVILSFIFNLGAFAQNRDYKNSSLSIDKRVSSLLSQMSLEEKVAQMRMFHANLGVELDANDKLQIAESVKPRMQYGIAGIKNPGEHLSPQKAVLLNNQLQKYIIDNNRFGIPALFVTESYNGVDADGCTKFGRQINMASSWNLELVHAVFDVIGREARIRGMNMCHSPEADLARDPRFGRMSETFGEDTFLTTEMVVSAIKGVQGDYKGLGNGTHIGAVVKHFAGYAQILGGRNFAAIEISPLTLIDEIYPPFQAAIQRANSLGVMASHGDLNGIPSHGNRALLTGVLRNDWGFKGYLVSDSNDIARLYSFMKVAETPEDAVIMALNAGVDVDLYSDLAYALLPEISKTHPELISNIDASVERVLRTKFILGLFDNPYVDLTKVAKIVRSKESLALAKKSDLESVILLKNENKILPLTEAKFKKIALLGPLVKENTKKDFELQFGNQYTFVSDKGFELTDRNLGLPKLTTNNGAAIDRLVATASASDAVILFLGDDEFTAKEAFFNGALGDRDNIDPVGQQDELLLKIKALGKPIIVVLKHRRTLSINAISKQADAVLDCWDMSEFGDQSVAKIISGEVCPSGKSPVTIPRSIGQIPFHYSQKEINFKKGYLFTENGPLYPFGFGLSYTTFDYSDIKISNAVMASNSELTASVVVSNTGKIAGKEVVQLYIKDIIGSVTRPNKELKGFEKIELAPGESKTVQFKISPEMVSFTGSDLKKIVEPGDYQLMIGTSSEKGLLVNFKLTK